LYNPPAITGLPLQSMSGKARRIASSGVYLPTLKLTKQAIDIENPGYWKSWVE